MLILVVGLFGSLAFSFKAGKLVFCIHLSMLLYNTKVQII